MAENADSEEARRAHHELANGYAARIAGAKCPRALAGRMIERLSRADTAVQLREQPASFRRLAKRARTPGDGLGHGRRAIRQGRATDRSPERASLKNKN